MDQFIGEIRILPYTFAPDQWLWCDGTYLSINQFSTLYAVIGIQFGGDGRTTFALPNLNNMAVMGAGNAPGIGNFPQGYAGGVAGLTLTKNETPSHTHTVSLTNAGGTQTAPAVNGNVGGIRRGVGIYTPEAGASQVPMASDQLAASGGNLAHENRQPFQTLGYCIAYDGYFPPRP